MGFRKGNDGQAANFDERRIREEFFGFDFAQCDGLGKWLSGFNLDCGIFGVGVVHGDDGGGADGTLLVTGVINDQLVASVLKLSCDKLSGALARPLGRAQLQFKAGALPNGRASAPATQL